MTEAARLGVIIDYRYQPDSLKLFESVDYVNSDGKKRCLFRDHVYTPDFMIEFNPAKNKLLAREFKLTDKESMLESFQVLVDVKGTFNKTERAFGLNQKWCWQKF